MASHLDGIILCDVIKSASSSNTDVGCRQLLVNTRILLWYQRWNIERVNGGFPNQTLSSETSAVTQEPMTNEPSWSKSWIELIMSLLASQCAITGCHKYGCRPLLTYLQLNSICNTQTVSYLASVWQMPPYFYEASSQHEVNHLQKCNDLWV